MTKISVSIPKETLLFADEAGHNRRKVCCFTGTRADYGLLKPLLLELKEASEICLQILASGSHLSGDHGYTVREIEKDGFLVDEKVEIDLQDNSPVGVSNSAGKAVGLYAEALKRLHPELVVVLGDRYEALSMAFASLLMSVPVAHISGGELTQGAIDDSIRHAITKLSHIHFTATEQYQKRVIQLGEDPAKVFNIGEIGLDGIRELPFLSRVELEEKYKFCFKEKNYLVTFHPVTHEADSQEKQILEISKVIESLAVANSMLVITKANADAGGDKINEAFAKLKLNYPQNVVLLDSMGRLGYLSMMKASTAVLGNSSSGIVEAPSLQVPSINIGTRQQGRIFAPSVLQAEAEYGAIMDALKLSQSEEYLEALKNVANPYYQNGTASKQAMQIITKVDLKGITKKLFYDLE